MDDSYARWKSQPIHYEIHLTVKTTSINKFVEDCNELGVKPIVLALQFKDGSGSMQDVMTSSKVTGSDEDAFKHMEEISLSLSKKGYFVVRKKIETVPWHSKALVHGEDSKEGYFEAHAKIKLVSDCGKSHLKSTLDSFEFHLSKNARAVDDSGGEIFMATLRKKDVSYDLFDGELRTKLSFFQMYGIEVVNKPVVEYALYDSNVAHDVAWTG